MKESPNLSCYEQQLLNQRGIIETIFNCMKHKYHIWHTRHRSVINTMSHLMAALAAYTIEPLKLSAFKLLLSCLHHVKQKPRTGDDVLIYPLPHSR